MPVSQMGEIVGQDLGIRKQCLVGVIGNRRPDKGVAIQEQHAIRPRNNSAVGLGLPVFSGISPAPAMASHRLQSTHQCRQDMLTEHALVRSHISGNASADLRRNGPVR